MRTPLLLVLLSLVLTTLPAGARQDDPGAGDAGGAAEPAPPANPQRDRERAFEALLTGAELVGHFTLGAVNADAPPREERYSISAVTKIRKDTWRFDCRVRYGDHDVTVPIPIKVLWSGDTPVVTLTDKQIPGLGRFTARVLFYNGKYAGTWSGGDHGGHLFGRIERANDAGDGATPGTDTPSGP